MKVEKAPLWIKVMTGIIVTVVSGLAVTAIVGNITMFGDIQWMKGQMKDFPTVNGLIVTQDMLQDKLDKKDHDSFMAMFCKFVEEYKVQMRKQDSVNKLMLKMVKRGFGEDTVAAYYPDWLNTPLCKECIENRKKPTIRIPYFVQHQTVYNVTNKIQLSYDQR